MSNVPNPTDDDDELEPQGGIAALRESSRRGQAAIEENAHLTRRIMFLEAGVDLSNEIGEMLFATWKGTDPAELVEKATRLGALKGAAPAPKGPTAEELAAQAEQERQNQERQALQDGMAGGGQPSLQRNAGVHPRTAALEEYHKAYANGEDPDIARDEAMAKVLGAAYAQNDPRMTFDLDGHKAKALEADRAYNRGGSRTS